MVIGCVARGRFAGARTAAGFVWPWLAADGHCSSGNRLTPGNEGKRDSSLMGLEKTG